MCLGYLWLPGLSIQLARHRHPRLRECPLIIGDPAGRGRVFDASPECRAVGVRSGMAMREAIELIPSAVCLPPSPDQEAEVFAHALDLLERFSDALEEDGRRGAWFLPATLGPRSPAARGRDERRLGAAIVDGLAAALGLEARVGIASGKHLARLAAERLTTSSVEVIASADTTAYLDPLPVTFLPLLPRAIERLKLLGVTTIGAFAHLPVEELPRRFGPEATLAWRIARGDDDTPLVPRRRPEICALRQSFDPPIEDRDLLLNAARSLLERLSRSLQEQRRTFRSLRLTIGLDDGRSLDRSASLRAAVNEPRSCHALLREMIAGLRLDQSAASISVQLEAIAPEILSQGELFDGGGAERRARLTRAITEVDRRYHGRLRRVVPGDQPASLLDDRRLLLLPYEPAGASINPGLAESATRAYPVHLIAQGERIYLIINHRKQREGIDRPSPASPTEEMAQPGITGRWRDEIVALHARWEANEWWPGPTRRTYYRIRTRRGLIATLARDHEQKIWLLIESFD